ncbi:MAG TPA: ribose 5-phosphate isomerase B [Clostridia bacterium]|nr:ribose 5-phosphate isomerase B [Clostridia bacterium]
MIALGCDHAGLDAKQKLIAYLEQRGYKCKDFGTYTSDSCDYPDFAYAVAKSVQSGQCDRGILICGTGIGMSIAANKVKGIRCAACSDSFSAEMTRRHNNSNILAMGARVISDDKMIELAEIFLNTIFEEGRHLRRLEKIAEIERKEG